MTSKITGKPKEAPRGNSKSLIHAREERIRQMETLAGLGIVVPPGTPPLSLQILTASAFMSGREIATELGLSYKRVRYIIESYAPFRQKILENRDAILSGLYSSITYMAGKQMRDAVKSGKFKPKRFQDLQALANMTATTSRIAISHNQAPTQQAPATSPERRSRVLKALDDGQIGDNMSQTASITDNNKPLSP